MFGIWCKDRNDWLREQDIAVPKPPVLAFESKRAAQKRAAEEYGFPSYTQAKRKDWVEIREIG